MCNVLKVLTACEAEVHSIPGGRHEAGLVWES